MERPQLSSGIVALFVAIGLALLLPTMAASTAPGRKGLIAFVSYRIGEPDTRGIAVVQCDGHGFRLLTHSVHDRSPSWSPDGRQLVFERNGDFFLVRADATGLRRLTRGDAYDHSPAWSPDGRRIAFLRNTETTTELFVMRANGQDARLIYGEGLSLDRPTWSPDSQFIAFGEDFGSGNGAWIGITYASGAVEPWFPLPELELDDDSFPDWAPDGGRLAFVRFTTCDYCDDRYTLWVANPEGTWLHKVADGAGAPSWSPDGKRIAVDRDGGVAILDLNGRARLLVAPNYTDDGSQPAWQPLPR